MLTLLHQGYIKKQNTPKEVGALWTCLVGEYAKSSASRRVGNEVHMKAGYRKLGVWRAWDETSSAALCKRVFDFCLRLFLPFILNSVLDKMHNLKVKF